MSKAHRFLFYSLLVGPSSQSSSPSLIPPLPSFSRACLLPLPHSSVLSDSLARLVSLSSSASLSCPIVFTSALLALSSRPLLCPLLGGQHSWSRPHPGTSFLSLSMLSFLSALHSKLGEVKSWLLGPGLGSLVFASSFCYGFWIQHIWIPGPRCVVATATSVPLVNTGAHPLQS